MPEIAIEPDTQDVDAQDVEDALRQLFAEPDADPVALRDAESAGVVDDFRRVTPADVRVGTEGAGFGGVGEAIVIGIAVDVGMDVLKRVVIPFLERRFGSKIIKRIKREKA